MTEAELWQLLMMASGSTSSSFNLLLTIVFAYLATAYFVGGRLTGFQTLVVSGLFVYSAAMSTLGLYGGLLRSLDFISQLQEIHPDEQFVIGDSMSRVAPSLYAAVTFMAVPVSLLFMYQIRKNPKLGASSD